MVEGGVASCLYLFPVLKLTLHLRSQARGLDPIPLQPTPRRSASTLPKGHWGLEGNTNDQEITLLGYPPHSRDWQTVYNGLI